MQSAEMPAIPGVVISAMRGGAGKTILTLGIVAAWRRSGKNVVPFKKGPDYIDAGWLALAAGRPCYNLDTFLAPTEQVLHSYCFHTRQADMAVIEGNRGLYDGIDVEGQTSTAEIAKLTGLPVILCVDCTKTTRTMAAALSGLVGFDSDIRIKGVILNRVAGPRHENILRNSISHYCGIPVIGAIPKLRQQDFPERHMGLVPMAEHGWADDSVASAADIAHRYVDMAALEAIAQTAAPICVPPETATEKWNFGVKPVVDASHPPRVGIIRDSAFQFYYPDNIEALAAAGAEIVFTSPMAEDRLPKLDGLYIGGGFPETHAKLLSENEAYREDLRLEIERGLPVYAECGGLIFLGEALVMGDVTYPMVGALPIVFGLSKKPQGHGYTVSLVEGPNPYFEPGTRIMGHEFRYSTVKEWRGSEEDLVFNTERGTGFSQKRDAIVHRNVLATYTHLHALGTPQWAEAIVRKAKTYQLSK